VNERIAKLYDQALLLESNGDYVAGELNPEKFVELIVRECAALCDKATTETRLTKAALPVNFATITEQMIHTGAMAQSEKLSYRIKKHFGVE